MPKMQRSPSIVYEGSGDAQIWLQTSPATTASITVTNTSMSVLAGNSKCGLTSSNNNNHKGTQAESALNSLECWDYSQELECLQGPDGIELAFVVVI